MNCMDRFVYLRVFEQRVQNALCLKHSKIGYTCILLSFVVIDNYASTINDTILYRFSYSVKMRICDENKTQRDDEICVDIGERVIMCYSRWKSENRRLIDSVFSMGGNANDYQLVRQQKGFPSSAFEFQIYKNYPQNGTNCVIWESSKRLYYEENATIQQWEMLEGDTVILGYNCKKAQTFFRGRVWHVWYTMDIPISEGPWKLCGLPGMILKAEEGNGLFTFCCIGIKSHINEPLKPDVSNVVKSTYKKVQELMSLRWSDHERFKSVMGITMQIRDKGNKPLTRPKLTACLLEQ